MTKWKKNRLRHPRRLLFKFILKNPNAICRLGENYSILFLFFFGAITVFSAKPETRNKTTVELNPRFSPSPPYHPLGLSRFSGPETLIGSDTVAWEDTSCTTMHLLASCVSSKYSYLWTVPILLWNVPPGPENLLISRIAAPRDITYAESTKYFDVYMYTYIYYIYIHI